MEEKYGSRADVEDFMTQEEVEQICGIYLRAKKRKKEAETEQTRKECPCGFAKNTCDRNPAKIMEEVRQMLGQMCKLCRNCGCCMELEDEELPDFLEPGLEEPL